MAFSWAALLAGAKSALSTIAADAAPIEQAVGSLLPVVGLIPGAGPVVTAIEAGGALISQIAPTAVADATTAFGSIEKIVADAHPAITQLESLWDQIFHINVMPGGTVVLTPKTSTATAPVASIDPSVVTSPAPLAPPPGTAKS